MALDTADSFLLEDEWGLLGRLLNAGMALTIAGIAAVLAHRARPGRLVPSKGVRNVAVATFIALLSASVLVTPTPSRVLYTALTLASLCVGVVAGWLTGAQLGHARVASPDGERRVP